MSSYLEAAFNAVLAEEAKEPEAWYVILSSHNPYYGGPQEGGWWGEDVEVESYAEFPSEKLAEEAAEKVRVLAKDLSAEEQKNYGEHCLHSMEWLEARGLEASFLPEPDGEVRYSVRVLDHVPSGSRGCRQYS